MALKAAAGSDWLRRKLGKRRHVAGLLFVLTEPPLALAKCLLYGMWSPASCTLPLAPPPVPTTRAQTLWMALNTALIRTAGTAQFGTANVWLQELH
jgi:hypothetical protein